MNGFWQGIVTIALALVGLAILVVVFNSKNTSQVITSSGNTFTNALKAAMGPLGSSGGNLSYYNSSL